MEFIFAEPDTILVFTIFYKLFGGGTCLAMPKTICEPDIIQQTYGIWRRTRLVMPKTNLRSGLIVIEAWFRGY